MSSDDYHTEQPELAAEAEPARDTAVMQLSLQYVSLRVTRHFMKNTTSGTNRCFQCTFFHRIFDLVLKFRLDELTTHPSGPLIGEGNNSRDPPINAFSNTYFISSAPHSTYLIVCFSYPGKHSSLWKSACVHTVIFNSFKNFATVGCAVVGLTAI